MKDVRKIKENTPFHEIISRYRYDILSRHGFFEGEHLLPEEVPFIEQAINRLIGLTGIIENRWKPMASKADCPYIFFEDLEKKQDIEYYDMAEKDRRLIDLRIDEILEKLS